MGFFIETKNKFLRRKNRKLVLLGKVVLVNFWSEKMNDKEKIKLVSI